MNSRDRDARIIPRSAAAGIPLAGLAPDAVERLRSGSLVLMSEWQSLFGEARLRTRARAVTERTTAPLATHSHTTAAAMHRLPLFRTRDDRVHLIVPGTNARRNGRDVVRHHHPLPEEDVEAIEGLRCTTLSRTAYDVIRTTSLETAVVCLDAALRKIAWNEIDRSYDMDAAEDFRRSVLTRVDRNAGARGIRRARFVVTFGDGRAQLPGESVSRLWMHQLGVPQPQLQVRVDLGGARYASLDFAWPGLRRWAEFDGEFKYHDPALRDGRSEHEVRAAELVRERHIIHVTGWKVDRWGFDRLSSIDVFAAYLRSIGL